MAEKPTMVERLIGVMQKSAKHRDKFLFLVGAFCLWGAGIHLLDMLGLRRVFSELGPIWQVATIYLFLLDIGAAIGIFKKQWWGSAIYLFLVSVPQIIAYTVFEGTFGTHSFLLISHCLFVIGVFYFSLSEAVVQHDEM